MSARPSLLRRLGGAREGATAVEFGLVAPALLLLLFAIMETGWAMWSQASLAYVTQEAARCAAIQPTNASCDSSDDITAWARRANPQLADAKFTLVPSQACGTQVTATLPYKILLWPLNTDALTLGAKACHA